MKRTEEGSLAGEIALLLARCPFLHVAAGWSGGSTCRLRMGMHVSRSGVDCRVQLFILSYVNAQREIYYKFCFRPSVLVCTLLRPPSVHAELRTFSV